MKQTIHQLFSARNILASIVISILANNAIAQTAGRILDLRPGGSFETMVESLQAGDTLIVAGKGHEEGQLIAGVNHPFSDHEEIRKALGLTTARKVAS